MAEGKQRVCQRRREMPDEHHCHHQHRERPSRELVTPDPPENETLVRAEHEAGDRTAEDQHRPHERNRHAGQLRARCRGSHLGDRRRCGLHQELWMIREHGDQLAGAGVWDGGRRTEDRAENQQVGSVEKDLADLRQADPA